MCRGLSVQARFGIARNLTSTDQSSVPVVNVITNSPSGSGHRLISACFFHDMFVASVETFNNATPFGPVGTCSNTSDDGVVNKLKARIQEIGYYSSRSRNEDGNQVRCTLGRSTGPFKGSVAGAQY